MLLARDSSITNAPSVTDGEPKKSRLEPWQKEDAARLLKLFNSYRASGGESQEAFAANNGLKSQANMGHYLHGRQPLNLKAAISFAKGMQVPIASFSPTIAAQVLEAAPMAGTFTAPTAPSAETQEYWPFEGIDRQRVKALDEKSLYRWEGLIIKAALDLGLRVLKVGVGPRGNVEAPADEASGESLPKQVNER